MHNIRAIWIFLAIGVGCDSTEDLFPVHQRPTHVPIVPVASGRNALTSINACDGLETSLREREGRIMDRLVDANLVHALQMVNNPSDYCYDPNDSDCGFFFCADNLAFGGGAGEDMATAVPRPANGATSYSTTNNQVEGADEADFVKNDGQYVYLVAGDSFEIYSAWPASETHKIATQTIAGTPKRLFVANGRAVVFSDLGDNLMCNWDEYYGLITEGRSLAIHVLDISDPTTVVLERQLIINGSYVGARMIDGTVHTVIDFPEADGLDLPSWPAELPENLCSSPVPVDLIEDAFAKLREQNRAAIDRATIEYFLPSLTDTDYDGGTVVSENADPYATCNGFYEPSAGLSRGFMSVLSLPIANDDQLGATTIFGRFGEIYASTQSLYVAVAELTDDPGARPFDSWSILEQTVLHKFALSSAGTRAAYSGSGFVPGRVINQFAMDEYEGHLRVATTTMGQNQVFVLADTPAGLEVTGSISDIAPGEDIRAVRFDGNRGYVVTFLQTDPLFTFDLSEPNNPRMLGELEIPGFSTYIHFLDTDHLLTIGFDGDNGGWWGGIALQIFDVSNPRVPLLKHKESISTAASSSEAASNHLAFNYFEEYGVLAIPVAICGNQWDSMTFNGLLVYDVGIDTGLSLRGGVNHGADESGDCYSWWDNSTSGVKRSIFMEDYVFSISRNTMKVNHLDNLESDLVSLQIPAINDGSDDTCMYGGDEMWR